MQMSAPVAEFKILLIGDGGVDKTSFVKRHMTGQFEKNYYATQGANVMPITFYTTNGPIKFNLWDTAGQEKLGGLRDGYYVGSHAAILMFDVTSRITYKNIPKWYKDYTRICENTPVLLVGNKVDQKDRKVKARQVNFHRKRGLQYFDISVKSNFQYQKPFIWLLRQLTGDHNLMLVQCVTLTPVQHNLSASQIQEIEKQWKDLQNAPLPEEDDQEFL